MPIYVYQGNKQISTNAIRNNKVVQAIYAKEQVKDIVCVWGDDFAGSLFTYMVTDNKVTITGFRTNYQHNGHLQIPDKIKNKTVTSINSSAFRYCTGLTSVTIGNSVTSIGGLAFEGCTGLTSVTIGNSVTSIGNSAFYNTLWYNNQPDGIVYAGKVAYKYKGTMPFNTSIVLKEGTLGIADSAFYNCTGLRSITIPNSVTSIGTAAFESCNNLTNIYITDIAAWCNISGLFYLMYYGSSNKNLYINNELVTSITIPNGVTAISSSAFRGCTGLTTVTIPNSVTSIGAGAFLGCTGLTSITIPNSVKSIGNSAFENCTGLTSITFNGTIAQWNAISKGSNCFYHVAGKVICTDGTISI